MTKRIRTYQDLLDERQKLEQLLHAQKELVIQDFKEVKEELKPVREAITFIRKITSRDNTSFLLTTGASKLIDVLFKKVILARAGWLSKMIIPFFVKNYSSHVLAENKDKLLNKLFSWIGIKNANGQVKHDPAENPEA
jgi:hypothetical protein